MNFLSHFYFDRHNEDPNLVLGTVLPDLIKNARKDWNLRPEKKEELFRGESERSILKGWKRHVIIDRLFHNSDFFFTHTRAIRTAIVPALAQSAVRPSFMAHIALELMLDSILLTNKLIYADQLYSKLREVDRPALDNFLRLNKLDDRVHFFRFFDNFISAAYLHNYLKAEDIVQALKRVCMRIWPEPLNQTQLTQLAAVLTDYGKLLDKDYQRIFTEIESGLEFNGKNQK